MTARNRQAGRGAGEGLWSCPKCGRPFANRNQWHGCGPYTVEAFLEGSSAAARTLFDAFHDAVRRVDPDVTLAPAKTRIGFQSRIIYAAVNGLRRDALVGHLLLPRRTKHPTIFRIEALTECFVHHFRLRAVTDLDVAFERLIGQSYAIGRAPLRG